MQSQQPSLQATHSVLPPRSGHHAVPRPQSSQSQLSGFFTRPSLQQEQEQQARFAVIRQQQQALLAVDAARQPYVRAAAPSVQQQLSLQQQQPSLQQQQPSESLQQQQPSLQQQPGLLGLFDSPFAPTVLGDAVVFGIDLLQTHSDYESIRAKVQTAVDEQSSILLVQRPGFGKTRLTLELLSNDTLIIFLNNFSVRTLYRVL